MTEITGRVMANTNNVRYGHWLASSHRPSGCVPRTRAVEADSSIYTVVKRYLQSAINDAIAEGQQDGPPAGDYGGILAPAGTEQAEPGCEGSEGIVGSTDQHTKETK